MKRYCLTAYRRGWVGVTRSSLQARQSTRHPCTRVVRLPQLGLLYGTPILSAAVKKKEDLSSLTAKGEVSLHTYNRIPCLYGNPVESEPRPTNASPEASQSVPKGLRA